MSIRKMIGKIPYARNMMHQLRVFIHRGNKYICPFCGYGSTDLMERGLDNEVLHQYQIIGGGKRKCTCYQCGAYDREKLVYLFLRDNLKIFDKASKSKILHIAPEKKLSDKIRSCSFLEHICGDLFCEGYPSYVHEMNILNLIFEDSTFDIIICNHVLEHIEDDKKAMAELYRVLKPGGTAILQVPISKCLDKTFEDLTIVTPIERERIFGQKDHLRIYGMDYKDRLESVGFVVKVENISKENQKYGLNPDEDLFVCLKL